MDLSGNMTRQLEHDAAVDNDNQHISNIGRLVEDMELKMRNLLQEVYFGKAKDVVGDLRSECESSTAFVSVANGCARRREHLGDRQGARVPPGDDCVHEPAVGPSGRGGIHSVVIFGLANHQRHPHSSLCTS